MTRPSDKITVGQLQSALLAALRERSESFKKHLSAVCDDIRETARASRRWSTATTLRKLCDAVDSALIERHEDFRRHGPADRKEEQ